MATDSLNLRIDAALKKRLAKFSEKNGTALTGVVEASLRQYLRQACPTCGAQQLGAPGEGDDFGKWVQTTGPERLVFLVVEAGAHREVFVGHGLALQGERAVFLRPPASMEGPGLTFMRRQVMDWAVHVPAEGPTSDFGKNIYGVRQGHWGLS